MNSLAGLVGDGGDSVVQRISGHATRFGDSLKAQVEAIDAMMSSRQAELDDRLTDHHARFEQASNARLAEFDNASVAHQTVVELALATQASAINDAVRDGMANFETTFAQRSEELISRVNAETDSLTTRIDDKASTIEEAIAARVKALNETLAKNTIEIARGIGGGVDRFRDQVISPLQALSTQFDDAISAHGAALHESIADAADRFGAGLSAQRDEIAATLAAAIENLDAALAGRGDEIAGSLAARIEELRALMTGPEAVDFLTQLSQRGEQVSNEITGVSERAAQTFEYQTSGLIALMKRRSEDLIATITASAADSVHSLGACTGQLRAEVETSTTTLRAAAEVAQSQSSETINQLSSALTGQVETSTTALRAAAEVAQSQSSETINQLLSALTGQIEQSGAALREAIERDAGASVTALTTTSDRLREAVERNAGASVTALTTTSDRLRDELSQVLDRLGEASLALDRVVGGASDTLGAIKGDFSENIDELQRALGAMATQVSELDRMSSTAHSMSGPLIEHMAAYATALTEVSRDFAAKQETANQAFERRHASLQNLFAEIDAKSLDFDTAASRFAASFEESFNRAQARAQEISASLALATKGTASSVISQFEMIRENASKERESTERALQAAYEQANAQLSEVMHDTADRFRQAVAEVKQMAGDVQRHLDATRQELRRGVFELPEETNEAATAMRRVVSDQIKALRELTAVVTASGADFDVAEPAPATAPARFDALRNDAAPRNADSARDDGRALVAAPIAAESARTGAKSQRPRAPQAPASAPPTSPASAERGQSGWLSNLLAAASRDESRTAPGRAGNDPLEGISLDIAKFVDAEAAAEMWDRWRGGDTTAVSRRLYTAQGQQTFDEVRRRFRNDPQFQVSVTRYTQEFERLLAKIGQSDRDGAQSRSTLLSDAGKVYTMLAHASGRLG
jgi:phage host-nuclease inhibitor protein Gam